MAGQTTTDKDSLEPLLDAIKELRVAVRILQRPTGTSIAGLVAQVQAAIANLGAAVTAYLAGGFTTGSMSATGNIFVGGHLYAANVAAVVTGYTAAYFNGPDKRLGLTPSTIRAKQDVEQHHVPWDVLMQIVLVSYRLKSAVEYEAESEGAAAARYELGVIAEWLVDLGWDDLVIFDDDGQPMSVAYERFGIVAIDGLQQHVAMVDEQLAERDERIQQLELRLDAASL